MALPGKARQPLLALARTSTAVSHNSAYRRAF